MTKWHKGPPPHVGWWQTYIGWGEPAWRYWDGKYWSVEVWEGQKPEHVERLARRWASLLPSFVRWSKYWPENARVPRVKP